MENISVSIIIDTLDKKFDISLIPDQSIEDVEFIIISGNKEISQQSWCGRENIHIVCLESDSLEKKRRKAVKIARGKYILFTNSNEHLFYRCLEELKCDAEQYNCGLVQGGCYIINDGRVFIGCNNSSSNQYTSAEAIESLISLQSYYSKESFYTRSMFKNGLRGALIRKDIISALEDELCFCDDTVLLYYILKRTRRIRYISNPLLYVCDSESKRNFRDTVNVYNDFKEDKIIADYLRAEALISAKQSSQKDAEKFVKDNKNFYIEHKDYIDILSDTPKNKIQRMINYLVNILLVRYKKSGDRKKLKSFYLNNTKKKIFIVSAPTHDNLGDQAILVAEEKFIKEKLPEYETVVLTEADYYLHRPFMKKYMGEDDVIAFHGGGNIGDGYRHIERYRREVIKDFKDKRFFIFPQTAYFSDSNAGRNSLKRSVKAYEKNKNLCIFAREKTTFDVLKSNFDNKVMLCPDIVMSMNFSEGETERHGILLCLRNDFERNISFELSANLIDELEKRFGNVGVTDMYSNTEIYDENRNAEIERKISLFKQYSCVVTDRLHGMIFAAISGTPCVAIGNYNHKVKSSYEWLRFLPYIKFVTSLKDVPDAVGQLKSCKDNVYDNSFALKYYDNITKYVKKEI